MLPGLTIRWSVLLTKRRKGEEADEYLQGKKWNETTTSTFKSVNGIPNGIKARTTLEWDTWRRPFKCPRKESYALEKNFSLALKCLLLASTVFLFWFISPFGCSNSWSCSLLRIAPYHLDSSHFGSGHLEVSGLRRLDGMHTLSCCRAWSLLQYGEESKQELNMFPVWAFSVRPVVSTLNRIIDGTGMFWTDPWTMRSKNEIIRSWSSIYETWAILQEDQAAFRGSFPKDRLAEGQTSPDPTWR